jgi:hypothetical protein
MSAEARIYRPGVVTPQIVALAFPPDRKFVESAVGGVAERVRGFECLLVDGSYRPCIALRNCKAKADGWALNSFLDNLWKKAVNSRHGTKLSFLYGPVVVVTGDDDFMDMFGSAWP